MAILSIKYDRIKVDFIKPKLNKYLHKLGNKSIYLFQCDIIANEGLRDCIFSVIWFLYTYKINSETI